MSKNSEDPTEETPPAMGERYARWGYGYQDKVATERILRLLKQDLTTGTVTFEGVRLADLLAGRVDDFVLIHKDDVEGNSLKWERDASPLNWADLIGTSGLLPELLDGWRRLRTAWPDRTVSVRLTTNRPASAATHHRQIIPDVSVETFFISHWPLRLVGGSQPALEAVWKKIAESMGLSLEALAAFSLACNYSFGYLEPQLVPGLTADIRQYNRQFDRLHKAIATWLTNNPNDHFIAREYLFSAIDARDTSQLIQAFPGSTIPYERNRSHADRMKQAIKSTASGYLALKGAAGVGKSTLVQDVLTESMYPFVARYYGFLPGVGGNRDRAEALTFFQDVVAQLERFDSVLSSLGTSSIQEGREGLRRHFEKAKERFLKLGHKTILLVDGLDHMAGELGIQQPLLQELPPPAEVPPGVLIVLSGQPQAFLAGVIPSSVAASVADPGRQIEVTGLAREEVHAILSRLKKPTSADERDALFSSCAGNPYILSLLVAELEKAGDVTVGNVIDRLGGYRGEIDSYYRQRLATPLDDSATRRILGLLARAAPSVPLSWLREWPEWHEIEDLCLRVLAPFVDFRDGAIRFAHHSVIAFLRRETRSRLPAIDPVDEEREYHSMLADRCGSRSCLDPVGRAGILHLQRAGRTRDVVGRLSSGWLREGIYAFLPFEAIHSVLVAGLKAAVAGEQWGDFVRLTLLDYEMDQRTARTEKDHLAKALLDLDETGMALSQLQWDGRLLVEDETALRFAGTLHTYARTSKRPEIMVEAQRLYGQCKPISILRLAENLDGRDSRQENDLLVAWSEVAPFFDTAREIVETVDRVRLRRNEPVNQDPSDFAAILLSNALAAAHENDDALGSPTLLAALKNLDQPSWYFPALLGFAESEPSADVFDDLECAFPLSDPSDDTRLVYAWFLLNRGQEGAAREVASALRHIRFEPYTAKHGWGLNDVTYTVGLRSLQERLGLPEGVVPAVREEHEEPLGRVEQAARRLGEYRVRLAQDPRSSELLAAFRWLLLFDRHAVRFESFPSRNEHLVGTSRTSIFEQIGDLATHVGPKAVSILREVFLELDRTPGLFGSHHRRYFAYLFFEQKVVDGEDAWALASSETDAHRVDDPTGRQKECLEIAILLSKLGKKDLSLEWRRRAAEVAVGAGNHKDYHMEHLAKWLSWSVTSDTESELLVLEKFARAVEVAGGSARTEATASLLRTLMRLNPARMNGVMVEFIDREELRIADALGALIAGGASLGASADLLGATYRELYSLIEPDRLRGDLAVAVMRSSAPKRRAAEAIKLMNAVRTNSIPRQRAGVARALQDAMRQDELQPVSLVEGLGPGADDSSSKGFLYLDKGGARITAEEVAMRLSDPRLPDTWNPNPTENAEFDWWPALQKVQVTDSAHLDLLLAAFPPPPYVEVELLAWKAATLIRAGQTEEVRALADQAIERAKEGSWHHWFDGAQKRIALSLLKLVARNEATARARQQLEQDIDGRRFHSSYLLSDIGDILELLDVEWPADAARRAIDDYLTQVLAANEPCMDYAFLKGRVDRYSVEEAICRFLALLVSFPVRDVGVAARRALASYFASDGTGVVAMLQRNPWWDTIQLEHILVAIHAGSQAGTAPLEPLRPWLLELSACESLAVRSVARRICLEQGWAWQDVTNQKHSPTILLVNELEDEPLLLDRDVGVAWKMHGLLTTRLESLGMAPEEVRSQFQRIYETVRQEFAWADETRVRRWMTMVLARSWIRSVAAIGREAAMRLFGGYSLSGHIPPGAESEYDQLYPVYDHHLELLAPAERPAELLAGDWRLTGAAKKSWFSPSTPEWSAFPELIQDGYLIGERTVFTWPEWDWPHERRWRGIVRGDFSEPPNRKALDSDYELPYGAYLAGHGQRAEQVVVLNTEMQLQGPSYRWAAINANLARALGWLPSPSSPFEWLDGQGKLMVKSVFWRDGWIWLSPPRFESLGEGWAVVATSEGMAAIRALVTDARIHLWVDRTCQGDEPEHGAWHLSKGLGPTPSASSC